MLFTNQNRTLRKLWQSLILYNCMIIVGSGKNQGNKGRVRGYRHRRSGLSTFIQSIMDAVCLLTKDSHVDKSEYARKP